MKTTRILALLIALTMLLNLSALASGEPSGPPSGETSGETPMEKTADMTVSSYATLDNFRRDDSGFIYVGYDVVDGALTEESNWQADSLDFVLSNTVEGAAFTAVHAAGEGSDVTITGTVDLYNPADDSQGVHASDFSGTGCAIVLANCATARIEDLDLTTDGFVRAALIVDNYATAWVKDSSFVTYGANPLTEVWDGYYNSANTGMMLSPPWVLGIQGGIRTVNVLDNQATLVIENSKLSSGGWGVISTDGCTNPVIYVIDSELRILPESEGGMDSGWALFGYDEDAYGSGYGAYIIGNVDEYYYGSDISGATFGSIAREGSVSYASSNGDIALTSAQGEDMGIVKGAGNPTTINAVFGSQVHSSESTNVSYLDGTIVNAEEAVFLYRTSGHTAYTVDSAELHSGSGILLQMMDDDDPLVGGFSPFNEFFHEAEGTPSHNGSATGATENCEEATITFTNGSYEGDLYNGTGYYGGQAGDVLTVNIGEGASLDGGISLTETFHAMPYSAEAVKALDAIGDDVTYLFLDAEGNICAEADAAFIQFTQFSIRQYYMLCHVANLVHNNGYSAVNVNVTDGGVWTVAEEGIINYLNIDGGTVYGTLTENTDGSLTLAPGADAIPAGEYGTAVEANVAASQGMGNAGGPGGPGGSGEPSGEGSGESNSEEPASGEQSVEDAYIEYIREWLQNELLHNDQMTQEQIDNEYMPLIEAGNYTSWPASYLYDGWLETGTAMTFEEFAVQFR